MQQKRLWRSVGFAVLLLLTVLAALLITGEIDDGDGGSVVVVDLPGTESIGGENEIATEIARSPSAPPITVEPAERLSAKETMPSVVLSSTPVLAGSSTTAPSTLVTAREGRVIDVTGTINAPVAPTPTRRPVQATQTISSTINDLPRQTFIVMPVDVSQHAGEIFLRGQAIDRDAHHFSVLGDSIADPSAFLTGFDEGQYDLGDYAHLQPVIEYYSGSFSRQGLAVRPGLNLTAVFDPLWADKEQCEPNETILDCELRLHNPSVLLILVGTNDAPLTFEERMRPVIQYAIDNGIIPVLVTKALRAGGVNNPRNEILRQMAAEYRLPLWDFGLLADTLPNRGLDADGVHMTQFPEHDYTLSWALASGYGVYNLTALMVLDAILQDVILGTD